MIKKHLVTDPALGPQFDGGPGMSFKIVPD